MVNSGSEGALAPPVPGHDAKITPEMAVFVQLDELNGRMAELTALIASTIPKGINFSVDPISVTDVPTEVRFDVIGYTLFNDGPNTIFTSDYGPAISTGGESGLESGDSDVKNLVAPRRVIFWIVCAALETATVRIRGLI